MRPQGAQIAWCSTTVEQHKPVANAGLGVHCWSSCFATGVPPVLRTVATVTGINVLAAILRYWAMLYMFVTLLTNASCPSRLLHAIPSTAYPKRCWTAHRFGMCLMPIKALSHCAAVAFGILIGSFSLCDVTATSSSRTAQRCDHAHDCTALPPLAQHRPADSG